jgi:hypothetical protein
LLILVLYRLPIIVLHISIPILKLYHTSTYTIPVLIPGVFSISPGIWPRCQVYVRGLRPRANTAPTYLSMCHHWSGLF